VLLAYGRRSCSIDDVCVVHPNIPDDPYFDQRSSNITYFHQAVDALRDARIRAITPETGNLPRNRDRQNRDRSTCSRTGAACCVCAKWTGADNAANRSRP